MEQTIHTTQDIQTLFNAQRQNARNVANTGYAERREKLIKFRAAVLHHRQAIRDALKLDLNKPDVETDGVELYRVMSDFSYALQSLRRWTRPKRVRTPFTLFGTRSFIQYEPKGVCLIISPWNFPIDLTFGPLVYAVAAGNCVVIKPSEMSPNASRVMADIVREIFPPNEVCVVEGGVEVSNELLALPFNHIFFTGSPQVGKVVMRAAAAHLASVTLELGGKSPVIVDETAAIDDAARRLVVAKYTNCGQICVAPDYILVDERKVEALIERLKHHIQRMYGATDEARLHGDFSRIINQRHFQRLQGYVDDAVMKGAKLVFSGNMLEKERYMSPILLTQVHADMKVMQEEIFGPIFPIKTYKKIEEAVAYINSGDKPLALYIFSKNRAQQDYILQNTSAGGVTINNAAVHPYNKHLPFGGVNNSGIGKSGGDFAFEEFSNAKAVLRQLTPTIGLEFFYPPFTERSKRLIERIIQWL